MGTECIYWPCQGHVVSHLVVGRLVSGKGDVEVSLLCGGERGDAKVPWLYLPHQAASYRPSESLSFQVALSAVPRRCSTYSHLCLAWPEPAKESVFTVW